MTNPSFLIIWKRGVSVFDVQLAYEKERWVMPINIPKHLPAGELLKKEKIFVMDEDRAVSQDIRPLNIIILNLMPEKEKTELQLLRLLGNTPLQVHITFMTMAPHKSKNTRKFHLDGF